MLHLQREMHIPWTSSLRVRGDADWRGNLVYGTVGLAAARATVTARDSTFAAPQPEVTFELPTFVFVPFGSGISQSQTHVGWTLGAGTEREWSSRTTIALEYRYSNFGMKTYNLAAVLPVLPANPTQAQSDNYFLLFEKAFPGVIDGTSPAHGLILPEPQRIRLSGAQVTVRANVRLPLW
jgi:opacity protein-like surface antigen